MLFCFLACLYDKERFLELSKGFEDNDQDGWMAMHDCDDQEATIHPEAPEICDGVDQNCDGEIDENATDARIWFADEDRDGFGNQENSVQACEATEGLTFQSNDCDDSDAMSYPGATEIPYDGIDQDCDGADLVDGDGDGVVAVEAGGEDCEDENPAIPGEEVPYDGVDQDCDGGDLVDVDGDGVVAVEAGGEDCDDTDALVFPEAEESWENGFTDNDCDGELEAIVLEFGANAWAGTRENDLLGRSVVGLGDTDWNGLAEVAIGGEYDSTLGPNSGALYRVEGTPGGLLPTDHALFPEMSGQSFALNLDASRDVTEDGVAELLVTQLGTATTRGAAYLVDGAVWRDQGTAVVSDVLVGVVEGSIEGSYGPAAARFVGDVTGDGVEDIAVGECCGTALGASTKGRVGIFSESLFSGTVEDADILIEGPWDGAYLGYEVDRISDQDGDGLGDLLLSGTGGMVGAVVGGTQSGNLGDLAQALIYGTPAASSLARNIEDVDGDGREDVAIVAGEEGVFLFTALHATPTRVMDSPSFKVVWDEVGGVNDVVTLGDRDGDGKSELWIPLYYSDSGNDYAWILPGSEVVFGKTLNVSELGLSGISVVPGVHYGYRMAMAEDVDGDGLEDLVVGAPVWSSEAYKAGGATLITVPQ
jgi:hypothetical protein